MEGEEIFPSAALEEVFENDVEDPELGDEMVELSDELEADETETDPDDEEDLPTNSEDDDGVEHDSFDDKEDF